MQLVIISKIVVIAVITDVQFEPALLQRLLDQIAQFSRSERRLQLALGLSEAVGAPIDDFNQQSTEYIQNSRFDLCFEMVLNDQI